MPFVEFNAITKRFPGVLALDGVGFAVERGSCHALMGENGAGKSTLGKILAGVYTANEGDIRLDGKLIHPATPLAARHLGIAMVHQELAFCPNLTVAENLSLGSLPSRFGWVDRRRMRDRAHGMLREIEADLDVDQPIGQPTTGQEQMVQIAAALGLNARVIVMDEPTSSLSAGESEHIFHLLAHLKQRGITALYVSHRIAWRKSSACATPSPCCATAGTSRPRRLPRRTATGRFTRWSDAKSSPPRRSTSTARWARSYIISR